MVLDSSFINFIALFKIPAFGRRALLSWRRTAAAAAGWACRLVADTARGHHGRGLPHKLQLRVAARVLPGRALCAVLGKVLCDQELSGPVYISAFYFSISILQEKDDIFFNLRQKFWNTCKSSQR